jgi:hypothetical protein
MKTYFSSYGSHTVKITITDKSTVLVEGISYGLKVFVLIVTVSLEVGPNSERYGWLNLLPLLAGVGE